ncbi:MAG TPA: hypothetical protein VFS97_13405 [Nitrososphaeraceae archaeon]|nr:hypothetical protein [Nitrososphaeraceae archaeon]
MSSYSRCIRFSKITTNSNKVWASSIRWILANAMTRVKVNFWNVTSTIWFKISIGGISKIGTPNIEKKVGITFGITTFTPKWDNTRVVSQISSSPTPIFNHR